ncbi:MAG TPA: undecaprenyl-diphosphate phosphatase [Opitutaceae bacterium]
MSPTIAQIILLAAVQGAAELLPVSSSAHVIVAEKLMHLDAASPGMLFLMVMLHTDTMAAVLAYFWRAWARTYFSGPEVRDAWVRVAMATAATGAVALVLKEIIEKLILGGRPAAAVEDLSGNLYLITAGLAAAGVIILISGHLSRGRPAGEGRVPAGPAWVIGAVQGLCLPFRGLSRSGTTISTGMLLGVPRRAAEEFSFALAVVLTPAVIAREFLRYYHASRAAGAGIHLGTLVAPGLIGMVFSFLAGLAALRWLSGWLEHGKWHYFGFYCLAASAGVGALAAIGY